jgi:hypothetical protein
MQQGQSSPTNGNYGEDEYETFDINMTIYLFIYLCFEFYQNKLHKGINLIGFFFISLTIRME